MIQSMLFVPGSKPERFAKALASGADCVCIDLEDAVPRDNKADARKAAIAAMGEPRLAIRINGVKTVDGLLDLLAIESAAMRPHILFVPMVESAVEIELIRSILGKIMIVPLIETVLGLRNAHEIASSQGTGMIMFGGGDFSSELGVDLAWSPLLAARSAFVMAAAGAGIPAMDVPFISLDDPDGLADECKKAKALGFSAKAAIHPDQIETIHAVFRPTIEQILEAEAAEAAFSEASGAAVRFKGKILEAPLMRRYRQILSLKGKINA